MNMLVIHSSILGANSKSRQVADDLVGRLASSNPGVTIRTRDLGMKPLPYLDGERVGALFTPADKRTEEQAELVALADGMIAEISAAETVVIGVPLYNFSIPAQLKTYIDYIARAGVTFKYGANGPEGLLKDKKVYVVVTRGGVTAGTQADSVTPYLRTILSFLGMDDITFINAEGLNMGDEAATAGLANARNVIEEIAGELALAA
jgi:FMN-dependent NADH-azoreductase